MTRCRAVMAGITGTLIANTTVRIFCRYRVHRPVKTSNFMFDKLAVAKSEFVQLFLRFFIIKSDFAKFC